jgi:hypothetical protein
MAATGELRKLGSFKLVDVHEFYEDDHNVELEPSLKQRAIAAKSAVPGNPTGMACPAQIWNFSKCQEIRIFNFACNSAP